MGIQNKDGALYFATGVDNTGLYTGRREAIGIIKAMAGEISSFDAFGGLGLSAADAITTILNAYKMSASEAESVSDMPFTTARLGKTTMGELGQSIAQAAPIAASYGVEINQVLTAVASLTKQGTPTAQAMTQIRSSIIGVSKVLGDGAFNTRTFQETLQEGSDRSKGSESKLRELVPEIEAVNGILGMDISC